MELLRKLFGYKIGDKPVQLEKHQKNKLDWCSIFTELANGSFSIVATPLFSTFERTKQVGFTSPLFFSNVGLYVNQELAKRTVWQDLGHKGLSGLSAAINETPNLRFLSLHCEISDMLAKEHHGNAQIECSGSGEKAISDMLDDVAKSSEPHDVLFCESYYAERYCKGKGPGHKQVVNMLKWHQILYPVCFAVQADDYHLINLMNIRLLKLAKEHSMMDLLTKMLPPIGAGPWHPDVVKKAFCR